MNPFELLKNSLRNLFRQRFYTLLNIFGYGLGLTVFFLISIYVFEHYMTDRVHDQKDYLYRLESENFILAGALHGSQIRDNLPGVDQSLRITSLSEPTDLIYEDKVFDLPDLIFADPDFLHFFPLNILQGSVEHALKEPYSIIFTRSMAEAIFGTSDIIGEVVTLQENIQVQVYAVVDDVKYTHLKVQAIAPMMLLPEMSGQPRILKTNRMFNFYTFLKLDPTADLHSTNRAVNKLINQLDGNLYEENGIRFFLRPIKDIYFSNQAGTGFSIKSGSWATIKAFFLVGLFVLLIAMINYMNLSTAKAFTRAREVGIRKLLGASRWRLAGLFLLESLITTAFAVFFALLLIIAVLPHFNSFSGTTFVLQDISWPAIVLIVLGTILGSGLLSGIYPAFYISAFQPVAVLKGQLTPGKKGASFRKFLIVLQFSISVALIASTLIVLGQINYMKNQKLGFNPNNMVVFNLGSNSHKEALHNEIMKHPDVLQVSFSNAVPGRVSKYNTFVIQGEKKTHTAWDIDAEGLKMMEVIPLAGRYFDEELRSEIQNVIMINQAAIHFFGLKGSHDEIVGQKLNNQRIVGILPDFHYNNVSQKISPLVVNYNEKASRFVMIKTSGNNPAGVSHHIQQVYSSFFPGKYFRSFDLCEDYNKHYAGVERFSKILLWFSAFAIFISCLGVFGLASFMTAQRAREVAIRKIIGAESFRIYLLLFGDFIKLLGVSFLVAAPVAWLFMDHWLKGFAYQHQMTPLPFIIAGLVAIFITLLTISFHTLKVIRVQPAEILRNK